VKVARGSPKSARSKPGANPSQRPSLRLQFELRKRAPTGEGQTRSGVSEEALKQAAELVRNVFSSTAKAQITPEELPAKMEQTLRWAAPPGR